MANRCTPDLTPAEHDFHIHWLQNVTAAQLWPPIIHHSLRQFTDFLSKEKLEMNVHSFILLPDSLLSIKTKDYPPVRYRAVQWRCVAMSVFWRDLLSVINPERVAIVAQAMGLACATNLDFEYFTPKSYRKDHSDYRLLELRQMPNSAPLQPGDDVDPVLACRQAESGVLQLRPWTDVSLNEGSFQYMIGTHELDYRYDDDPLCTPSLLTGNEYPQGDKPIAGLRVSVLPSIQSFTYTAVMTGDLDLDALLSRITSLDLQLAPLPGSTTFNDNEPLDEIDLVECWRDIIIFYDELFDSPRASLATSRISRRRCPKLKRFVCRDVHCEALQPRLDALLTRLCKPVWAQAEPGVFIRLAESADAAMRGEFWENV